MTESSGIAKILTDSFRQIAVDMASLAESAAKAARSIRELHRNMLLYIRHQYVQAGKPYGNGYAPMMRWWRQHAEL